MSLRLSALYITTIYTWIERNAALEQMPACKLVTTYLMCASSISSEIATISLISISKFHEYKTVVKKYKPEFLIKNMTANPIPRKGELRQSI